MVGLMYGIISGVLIIGTTGTQLVVFIPKVSQLLGHCLNDDYITGAGVTYSAAFPSV